MNSFMGMHHGKNPPAARCGMCRVSEDVYDDSPPRERGIIIGIIMATRLVMSVGRVTGGILVSIVVSLRMGLLANRSPFLEVLLPGDSASGLAWDSVAVLV
jgi:hypothetical protein